MPLNCHQWRRAARRSFGRGPCNIRITARRTGCWREQGRLCMPRQRRLWRGCPGKRVRQPAFKLSNSPTWYHKTWYPKFLRSISRWSRLLRRHLVQGLQLVFGLEALTMTLSIRGCTRKVVLAGGNVIVTGTDEVGGKQWKIKGTTYGKGTGSRLQTEGWTRGCDRSVERAQAGL